MLETETMNDDHNDDHNGQRDEDRGGAALPGGEPCATAPCRARAADRQRISFRGGLLQAAAVIALIVLSPRLIDASVWISSRLDKLFAPASAWLATPPGLVVAALY